MAEAWISAGKAIITGIAIIAGASIATLAQTPARPPSAPANALPAGFVYLSEADPSILLDIRYFADRNFLGRRVKGYEGASCILTRSAAAALARVQARLEPDYALKVFDCYRPATAVADFQAWAANLADQRRKAQHYPDIDKSRLHDQGYIARDSRHSRGSTVDLTIVARNPLDSRIARDDAQPCAEHEPDPMQADGALGSDMDFGTSYDCFHARSSTGHPDVGLIARRNRDWLVSEMARAGFRNYSREWWHFELIVQPFKQAFDFPVRVPPSKLLAPPQRAARPRPAEKAD